MTAYLEKLPLIIKRTTTNFKQYWWCLQNKYLSYAFIKLCLRNANFWLSGCSELRITFITSSVQITQPHQADAKDIYPFKNLCQHQGSNNHFLHPCVEKIHLNRARDQNFDLNFHKNTSIMILTENFSVFHFF